MGVRTTRNPIADKGGRITRWLDRARENFGMESWRDPGVINGEDIVEGD